MAKMTRDMRHPNHRLVKIHLNYTVEEIAALFGIHKHTVRLWIKAGLPTLHDRRPTLVLGSDLSSFLHDRRTSKKRPCKSGEFYCFRCRVAKPPAWGSADCFEVTDKIGHLQAICPDCTGVMNRRVNLAKLGPIRNIMSVTFRKAEEQINSTIKPIVNVDLDKGAEDHE